MSPWDIIEEAWAFILAATGILAAIVIFLKNALTVRKLQLEIGKIKEERKEKSSIIARPTVSEIERYGNSINKWNIAIAFIISSSGLLLAQQFYLSIDEEAKDIRYYQEYSNSYTNEYSFFDLMPDIEDINALAIPSDINGELTNDKPVCWYKFEISQQRLVTLEVSHEESLDSVMYLFELGVTKSLLKIDYDGGIGEGSRIELPLGSGVYFLAIIGDKYDFGSTTGKFKLHIFSHSIPIIQIGQAREIPLNRDLSTNIWLEFIVPHSGLYGIDVDDGVDADKIGNIVSLYDIQKKAVQLLKLPGDKSNLSLVRLVAGKYYLSLAVSEYAKAQSSVKIFELIEAGSKK